jgi:hypothetical protein
MPNQKKVHTYTALPIYTTQKKKISRSFSSQARNPENPKPDSINEVYEKREREPRNPRANNLCN